MIGVLTCANTHTHTHILTCGYTHIHTHTQLSAVHPVRMEHVYGTTRAVVMLGTAVTHVAIKVSGQRLLPQGCPSYIVHYSGAMQAWWMDVLIIRVLMEGLARSLEQIQSVYVHLLPAA